MHEWDTCGTWKSANLLQHQPAALGGDIWCCCLQNAGVNILQAEWSPWSFALVGRDTAEVHLFQGSRSPVGHAVDQPWWEKRVWAGRPLPWEILSLQLCCPASITGGLCHMIPLPPICDDWEPKHWPKARKPWNWRFQLCSQLFQFQWVLHWCSSVPLLSCLSCRKPTSCLPLHDTFCEASSVLFYRKQRPLQSPCSSVLCLCNADKA